MKEIIADKELVAYCGLYCGACGKFNNFFSKMFKFLFKSDRNACVQMIKTKGYDGFAQDMAANKTMTLKVK